jgi:hypothetical protein
MKDKCCGNCKHFKNEDVSGFGFCVVFKCIHHCTGGSRCVSYQINNNGWTEITPDNVDEVRKTDVGRLMIAVTTHGEPYYMEFREMFRGLDEMARKGGYYYYVLPELKIE